MARASSPCRPVAADRRPSRVHRVAPAGGGCPGTFLASRSVPRVLDRVLDPVRATRRRAHYHATRLGGTHAYTEIVADSRGWRPAAGCGPVRRRYRRERTAVRLRQADTGAEGTRVRPAIPGTRRKGPANRHTCTKLAEPGDPP